MVRKRAAEKTKRFTWEKVERGEGESHADIWGRGFQAKEAISTKAPRQKHGWCVWETVRRAMLLGWNEWMEWMNGSELGDGDRQVMG